MQTDIEPLIFNKVYADRFPRLKVLAILVFNTLGISPSHIIGRAGRKPLGKFSMMIGVKLPPRLFLGRPANFHFHSINRVRVRPPYRDKQQRIGLI